MRYAFEVAWYIGGGGEIARYIGGGVTGREVARLAIYIWLVVVEIARGVERGGMIWLAKEEAKFLTVEYTINKTVFLLWDSRI